MPVLSSQPWIATSRPCASSPTATWPGCGRAQLVDELRVVRPRRCRSRPRADAGRQPRRRRLRWLRTPPPVCTLHATAAQIASIDAEVGGARRSARRRDRRRGSIARRPLRSGARPSPGLVVDRLARVVALLQPHDAAVAQVDRRVQVHHAVDHRASQQRRRSCRAAAGRRRRSSRGGTASPTRCRARPRPRTAGRSSHQRRDDRRRRSPARSSARSRATRDRAGPRAARSPATRSSGVPADLRQLHGRRAAWSPGPGSTPSPATPGASSLPSNSICIPMQTPRNGGPIVAASRASAFEPGRAQRGHARAEVADAGEHHADRVAHDRRGRP